MNTRRSLEKLLDLTKNERFRKAVRELEISLTLLVSMPAQAFSLAPINADEVQELANIQAEIDAEALQSTSQHDVRGELKQPLSHPNLRYLKRVLRCRRRVKYREHQLDQQALMRTGADVAILAEILRALPALQTIRIVNTIDKQNPPLAARQFYCETSRWPPASLHAGSSEYVFLQLGAYSVPLVLEALLQSNAELKTLNFCKMPYRPSEAKNAESRTSSLTPAGSLTQRQIADLELSKISRFELETWTFQYTFRAENSAATATDWFVPLIARLTSVRELTISTTLSDIGDKYLHLLAHIDLSALPRLHTLEITGRNFSSANVHDLVLRFGSALRRLSIHAIDTLDEYPTSVLPLLKNLPYMTFFQFCCESYKETLIAGETVDDFQQALCRIKTEYDELSYSEDSSSD